MLIYFLIFHVFQLSQCYDVELEGVMRLKQDFINKLNGDKDADFWSSEEEPAPLRMPHAQFTQPNNNVNLPPEDMPSENMPSKNMSLSNMLLGNIPIVDILSKILSKRNTGSMEAEARKSLTKDTFMLEYMKKLTEKGIQSLKSLERSVKEQLQLKIYESEIVENTIKDYISELKDHFEIIEKQQSDSDKALVLFDIVETSNKVLYSGKRRLINEIVNNNNADISKVQKIIASVFKESVYDKSDEFKYICETVNVCHIYPGFTDYMADLISEVLKLSNRKFTIAMIHLRNLILTKVKFLKAVIPDDIIMLIGNKIKPAAEKDLEMRKLMSVLRAVIVQRYKLVQSNDESVKMRTSAIRILLNIIDKAFGLEDESIMNMHFDSTVRGLRHYGAGYETDINSIINTFVTHFIGVLMHQLDKSTKDEMKALIEIIIKGTTNDMDRFRYLFTNGSKFDPLR